MLRQASTTIASADMRFARLTLPGEAAAATQRPLAATHRFAELLDRLRPRVIAEGVRLESLDEILAWSREQRD
jgi:hypothetical protein